jgi:hypothetical protein
VHEIVTLSLLAMWAASYLYVLFDIVTSVDYISKEDDGYRVLVWLYHDHNSLRSATTMD